MHIKTPTAGPHVRGFPINAEHDPTDGQDTNTSGPAGGSCKFSQVPLRKAETKPGDDGV